MPQSVGRDVFGDAGGLGIALDEPLNAADGEASVHAVFGVVLGAGVMDEEGLAGIFAGFEKTADPIGGLG